MKCPIRLRLVGNMQLSVIRSIGSPMENLPVYSFVYQSGLGFTPSFFYLTLPRKRFVAIPGFGCYEWSYEFSSRTLGTREMTLEWQHFVIIPYENIEIVKV